MIFLAMIYLAVGLWICLRTDCDSTAAVVIAALLWPLLFVGTILLAFKHRNFEELEKDDK